MEESLIKQLEKENNNEYLLDCPKMYKLEDVGNLVFYKNKQGIYKITNRINGKAYIGQTKNLYKRFYEHVATIHKGIASKRLLYRAIRKYGIENFYVEVLEECCIGDDEELKAYLDEREIYYIGKYQSEEKGYNLTSGGDSNPSYNKEVVRKRTHVLLNNKEVNAKLSQKGEKNPRAMLTDDMVISIRERYSSGERRGLIYKDFQDIVTYSTFQYAMYGKTWKHLPPPKKPLLKTGTLTSKDVYEMRELYREGVMVKDIAVDFNVSSKHASRVLNMGRWKSSDSIPEGYIEYLNTKKK